MGSDVSVVTHAHLTFFTCHAGFASTTIMIQVLVADSKLHVAYTNGTAPTPHTSHLYAHLDDLASVFPLDMLRHSFAWPQELVHAFVFAICKSCLFSCLQSRDSETQEGGFLKLSLCEL